MSATSQPFASKPLAWHHPSNALFVLVQQSCFSLAVVMASLSFISVSHQRKAYIPWKVHPKEHHVFPSSDYHELFHFDQNSFSPGNLFKSDSHVCPFSSFFFLLFAGSLPSISFFSWWKVLLLSEEFLASCVCEMLPTLRLYADRCFPFMFTMHTSWLWSPLVEIPTKATRWKYHHVQESGILRTRMHAFALLGHMWVFLRDKWVHCASIMSSSLSPDLLTLFLPSLHQENRKATQYADDVWIQEESYIFFFSGIIISFLEFWNQKNAFSERNT